MSQINISEKDSNNDSEKDLETESEKELERDDEKNVEKDVEKEEQFKIVPTAPLPFYNYPEKTNCKDGSKHCKNKGFILILGLLGTLFILSTFGFILMWCTNMFNEYLLSNLVLGNNTVAVDWWKNPPVKSYLKVHIFNYTNTDRFIAGLDKKLILDDLGPYVYIETISKIETEFINNTISYREHRSYQFDPERSKGKQYDRVIVPNVPMLTAIRMVKESGMMVKLALNAMLSSSESKLFKNLPASSFLWGYDDELIDYMHTFSQFKDPLPFEKFGILTNRNGTNPDRMIIHTGEGDISKIAMVQGFNDQFVMDHWSSDECNRIDGTDGSQFNPYLVSNKELLHVYIKGMCRRFPLEFDKEVLLFDEIPAWRYKAPDNVFDHPDINPENQCYCHIDTGSCAPTGLFNISVCSNGAPIFASFPHFYLADPELLRKFEGLKPDPEKHTTFADIHPRLAFPIDGASRFQINIQINKVNLISGLNGFADGDILPVVWLDIVPGELTQDIREMIYHSSFSANAVQMLLEYGTILLAALTATLMVIACYCQNRNKNQFIIPTTVKYNLKPKETYSSN